MEITRQILDHADDVKYRFKVEKGLSEDVIRKISEYKEEPEWMLQKRLESLKIFEKLKMPTWGPDLSKLDLKEITYFMIPEADPNHLPSVIKDAEDLVRKSFDYWRGLASVSEFNPFPSGRSAGRPVMIPDPCA